VNRDAILNAERSANERVADDNCRDPAAVHAGLGFASFELFQQCGGDAEFHADSVARLSPRSARSIHG
jgi:hypothetical protein